MFSLYQTTKIATFLSLIHLKSDNYNNLDIKIAPSGLFVAGFEGWKCVFGQ